MTKYNIFLIYFKILLKQYNIDYITEINYNYEEYFIHWYIKTNNDNTHSRHLHVSTTFINYIKECLRTNQKYILFPIIMHNPSSIYDVNYITNVNLNHVSIFMYNKKKKVIEYFDPSNNINYYDGNLLPSIFLKFINENFKNLEINHFKNVNSYNTGGLGIQSIQEKQLIEKHKILGFNIGLCAIYTIWFVEKRILTENDDPNNIIKKEIYENLNLTKFIMNYKQKLHDLCVFKINEITNNKEYYYELYDDIELIIDLIHSFDDTYKLNENVW